MLQAFGKTRMKFVAGAVLLSLASVAGAQTATLVGGGATLPAVGYAGDTTTRYIDPIDGSFLKAFADINSTTTSYCQTGSGGGKSILAGNVTGFSVNAKCEAGISPTGFTQNGGGSLTQAAFIGSDSPYTSAEFANYLTARSSTGGQPVQVPSVGGAVAIVFRKDGVESVQLTEDDVCRVFSGQVTTWNQLATAGALPGKVASDFPANDRIKLAYRSDGSGTSFAFTNHLSAKCGRTAIGGNGLATAFKTDQSFATGFSAYAANFPAGTTLPASGNPAVVQAVLDNDGSIGYAEAANAVFAGAGIAQVRNDATASYEDPTAFGPDLLPVTAVTDQVITGVDSDGRPVLSTLASLNLAHQTGCMALVTPNSYAKPAAGYPIVAVSYLIVNSKSNGATTSLVKKLVAAPYDSAVQANTALIGSNGLSFLSLSGANATTIANSCVAM